MAENRREEQKLWLIVFQIKAIRTRLNLLAIQYWLFATVAVLVGAAALIYLAALALNPLIFLSTAILVFVLAATATVRIARAAFRQAADPPRAAAVADERAELKGRLGTVLAHAATPPSSPLWPFLVEDTYAHRHQFEPSVVEPRWVSRAIFAPAAVCIVVAAILLAVRYQRRGVSFIAVGPPPELIADLGNLDIRPADATQPANARVYADPATMRQLAAKMADAAKADQNGTSVKRWMNQARRLAGALQDQVTGQQARALPPLKLKLRGEKSPTDAAQDPTPPPGDQAGNHPDGSSIMPPGSPPGAAAAPGGDSRPTVTTPEEADRTAQNGFPAQPGDSAAGSPQDQAGAKVGSGYASQSGSNHSAGADPEHLFGPPASQLLGSDSFRLSVDARPIDEASSGGAPAYLPPKVRVPLNAQQFPDEPLARTTVPFDDRAAIKRVFER